LPSLFGDIKRAAIGCRVPRSDSIRALSRGALKIVVQASTLVSAPTSTGSRV